MLWACTVLQILRRRVRVTAQPPDIPGPVDRHTWGHGETVLGIVDRPRQYAIDTHGSMVTQQGAPGVNGTWNSYRVRAFQADAVNAALKKVVGCQLARRVSRTVQPDHRPMPALLQQHEAITTNACRHRLDHTLHGTGRYSRINGIAASLKNLHCCQRRKGMAGRRSAIGGVDDRAAGMLQIAHGNLP